MSKLSKKEYILKAAKLYGLGKVEIDALSKHLDGKDINDFIARRCGFLYRLYKIYKVAEYNENIKPNEEGIINLNDYSFEKSNRRLVDSKIGEFWILGSNLDTYLATKVPDRSSEIESKFISISEKNNFLLPQLAKQMNLDATVYYKGNFVNRSGKISNDREK